MLQHLPRKQKSDLIPNVNNATKRHSFATHNFATGSRKRLADIAGNSRFSYGNMPLYSSGIVLQNKLSLNAPGDKYESEADTVANKIVQANSVSVLQHYPVQHGEQKQLGHIPESKGITPLIQTSETVTTAVSSSLHEKISGSRGNGIGLENNTQAFMSTCFGTDFSSVRIHADNEAASMNRAVSSKAFTVGNDIYFNSGEYTPGSSKGTHLLAHELTHVVQQEKKAGVPPIQRAVGDGHDLNSSRFSGNLKLEDAYDTAGPEIKRGDIGMHVRIIQQALIDAGETVKGGVDGDFETGTEAAVKSFQTKQGLTGADVTGTINAKTMALLDDFFRDHSKLASTPQSLVPSVSPTLAVEWPTGKAPSELSKGTRALKTWDKTEIERRRTTEVMAPPGGTLPDFKMNIAGNPDPYEKRIEDVTLKVVDAQFLRLGKNKAAEHKVAAKLHQWTDIEKVAVASKRETDRVFGNFAAGNPLKSGINLKDAWDQKETEFAVGGAAYEKDSIEWRVNKIIQDPKYTGKIDEEHGAVQSRKTLSSGQARSEAAIISDIRNRIISSRKTELIEIHKGWPGFADPPTHSVFIQRFKSSTDFENRNFMWRMFQTLIHEYIHTLAHSNYTKYADSLNEKKGGKTYREGMTEYFTKIVWESTILNDALRAEIEGPFHDPLTVHPILPYVGYGEAVNAEAVAGVAGLRNVMAAFFLGRIDLIGG